MPATLFEFRPGRSVTRVLIVLMGSACCSCGTGADQRRALLPVRGKVLFENRPTPGALVVLHPVDDPAPTALRPTGLCEADGTFKLGSYVPNDGAPAGKYRATVTWSKKDKDGEQGPSLLPARYAKPETAGLPVEITAGTNELKTFELRR